jgi:hypothetical protein
MCGSRIALSHCINDVTSADESTGHLYLNSAGRELAHLRGREEVHYRLNVRLQGKQLISAHVDTVLLPARCSPDCLPEHLLLLLPLPAVAEEVSRLPSYTTNTDPLPTVVLPLPCVRRSFMLFAAEMYARSCTVLL